MNSSNKNLAGRIAKALLTMNFHAKNAEIGIRMAIMKATEQAGEVNLGGRCRANMVDTIMEVLETK